MTILVLGGTGAMGRSLVPLLAEQGHDVVITSRTRQGAVGRLRYERGDARSDTFLQPLLHQQHWSAIVDFMVYDTARFAQRVGSLLAATDQYVFLSSARVYAPADGPLTEDSPRLLDVCDDADYLATDEYALAKARQEDLLRAAGRNWTVVRPYITHGPGRLQMGAFEKEDWLFRAMHGRSIVLSDAVGERLTTMTAGETVARAMAALLGRSAAMGEAFHITGPQPHRWYDIAEAYAGVIAGRTGRRPAVARVDFGAYLRLHRNPEQVVRDRVFDRVFDNSKIARFHPIAAPADALQPLRDNLATFLDAPVFGQITGWREARMDRLTGEHTPLWQIPVFRHKLRYIHSRYLKS